MSYNIIRDNMKFLVRGNLTQEKLDFALNRSDLALFRKTEDQYDTLSEAEKKAHELIDSGHDVRIYQLIKQSVTPKPKPVLQNVL